MLLLGSISMIYFLSLIAHLPVAVTVLLIIIYGLVSYKWLRKNMPVSEEVLTHKGDSIRDYALFFIGLLFIVVRSYFIEEQYGNWDAWWLWDYHAKYLQDPAYWRELFKLNDAYHPDYPLFVSSLIAFFWRCIGNYTMLVPYTFSIIVTLAVPAVIYLSLYNKNRFVAAVAYLMLAMNPTYLLFGLSQYADQPLGLMFLCALITMEQARLHEELVIVVAALLGCCIWMKNEGLWLSLVFVMFNARLLFANWKRFAAGIAFPVVVFGFLKLNAPANDLVKEQGADTFAQLFDVTRYKLVGNYFYTRFTDHTLVITACTIMYVIYCYLTRRSPGRNIWMLFTCTVGFGFVYILTPHDLSWHLATSFDRVLFQLVPAFVYVLARNFCELRLFVSREGFQ